MNTGDIYARKLDSLVLLAGPNDEQHVQGAHDALLKYLRGRGDAPNWNLWPNARRVFLQRWP